MSEWIDIGEKLTLAREQRAESILDVAHKTKIPARVIKDLEDNNYSNFASPVYGKSFLEQYSRYLEVDAAEWINALRTELVITRQESIEFFTDNPEYERPGFHLWSKKDKPKKNSSSLAPVLVPLITIGLLFFGVQFYKNGGEDYDETKPAKAAVTSENQAPAIEIKATADSKEKDADILAAETVDKGAL